jgi:hypothetical protein
MGVQTRTTLKNATLAKNSETQLDNMVDSMIVLESAQGAVTQATNQTTAVTVNATSGIITLVAAATNATVNNEFTVNNSFVKSTSVILITMQDENTTNSVSLVPSTHTIADGSFIISVHNPASSGNASATASKIHFLVINQ